MITLTGHPIARTHGRTTVIPFWAHRHPATVTCRLDAGPASPCQSPVRVHALALGEHRLRVRATNSRGSTTVTVSWYVLRDEPDAIASTPVYVEPPPLDG